MHLADCLATIRMSREAASDKPSIALPCMSSDRRGVGPRCQGRPNLPTAEQLLCRVQLDASCALAVPDAADFLLDQQRIKAARSWRCCKLAISLQIFVGRDSTSKQQDAPQILPGHSTSKACSFPSSFACQSSSLVLDTVVHESVIALVRVAYLRHCYHASTSACGSDACTSESNRSSACPIR